MKTIILALSLILFSCKSTDYKTRDIELKELKTFPLEGVNIRALVALDNNVGFGGSNGILGFINTQNRTIQYSSFSQAEFRSVAATQNDFFALTIGNPAILLKTHNNEFMSVYQENNEKVFYDSMLFLDNSFGLAVGDPTEDCISIITTHNGGKSWQKMPCYQLPSLEQGEALFAASNSNIATYKNNIWIVTGGKKSRVLISDRELKSWKSVDLPILQGEASQGAFSVDFYDENNGIIMGGDYLNPQLKTNTGAVTSDGGKSWLPIEERFSVGYVSCVKYIPNTNANELIAASPNGLFFSNDKGASWKKVSDKAYHSLLFSDEKTLIASGNGEISMFRLTEKR